MLCKETMIEKAAMESKGLWREGLCSVEMYKRLVMLQVGKGLVMS